MKIAKVALALFAVAAVAGCSTGPAPTPQVIVKTVEVPGPQPTPQVVTKNVYVNVVPQSCLDALEINAQAWTLNQQFVEWLVNENTWTDSDQKKFSNVIDRYVAARDECWSISQNTQEPSS